MKKIMTILSCLLASAALWAQQINDPNAQVRDVKEFHSIHVGNAFDVYLSQGNEEKVVVSAKDVKDVADIVVEVKNGVLWVHYNHKKWYKSNQKLKAYISFKYIDELVISGACDVDIAGTLVVKEDMKIDLSGASDLTGKIEVGKALSVELSGASDAKVSGRATNIDIDATGASSFKGFDFAVDNCNAKATGASDIKITVNKELSAKATGASSINYKGSGVIRDIKTSGASGVSRS